MNTNTKSAFIVFAMCFGAVALWRSNTANAGIAMSTMQTARNGVAVGGPNLAAAKLGCGDNATHVADYSAIDCENDTTTEVYFCGSNAFDGGVTAALAPTVCPKRCNGCPGGSVYQPDVKFPQVAAWSAVTNDAGILLKCNCWR